MAHQGRRTESTLSSPERQRRHGGIQGWRRRFQAGRRVQVCVACVASNMDCVSVDDKTVYLGRRGCGHRKGRVACEVTSPRRGQSTVSFPSSQ
eukprot:6367146-Pyramimonas_sp.AAC.2